MRPADCKDSRSPWHIRVAGLFGGASVVARPRAVAKGVATGVDSGITTMVAHAGGPPLAMCLLGLGLPTVLDASTTGMVFTVGGIAGREHS